MLATSPTTATKTIPSYLYWQYQGDPNLQAFIDAYNLETQSVIDWFNTINLPIYTKLTGDLLDWVGVGLYGYPRPIIGSSVITSVTGQTSSYPITDLPTADIKEAVSQTTYTIPDDIYKRMLTWFFYKGDGEIFSVTWLKRRIYRFLYGINGTDAIGPFTPTISVTFTESSIYPATCNITVTSAPAAVAPYLEIFINSGFAGLPFRFNYVATITP